MKKTLHSRKFLEEQLSGTDPLSLLMAGHELLDNMELMTSWQADMAYSALEDAAEGSYSGLARSAQHLEENFCHDQEASDEEIDKRWMFVSFITCLAAGHGSPELLKALPRDWIRMRLGGWLNPAEFDKKSNLGSVILKMNGLTLPGWMAMYGDRYAIGSIEDILWDNSGYGGDKVDKVPAIVLGIFRNPNKATAAYLIDRWKDRLIQSLLKNNPYPEEETIFRYIVSKKDGNKERFEWIVKEWLDIKHPVFRGEDPERKDALASLLFSPPFVLHGANIETKIHFYQTCAKEMAEKGLMVFNKDEVEWLFKSKSNTGWACVQAQRMDEIGQDALVEVAKGLAEMVRDKNRENDVFFWIYEKWLSHATKLGMETPDILHQAKIGGLSKKENIERASLAFTAWASNVAGGGQMKERVVPERTRPKM